MYSILNMEKMSCPAASADARVLSYVLNYPSSFFIILVIVPVVEKMTCTFVMKGKCLYLEKRQEKVG